MEWLPSQERSRSLFHWEHMTAVCSRQGKYSYSHLTDGRNEGRGKEDDLLRSHRVPSLYLQFIRTGFTYVSCHQILKEKETHC